MKNIETMSNIKQYLTSCCKFSSIYKKKQLINLIKCKKKYPFEMNRLGSYISQINSQFSNRNRIDFSLLKFIDFMLFVCYYKKAINW